MAEISALEHRRQAMFAKCPHCTARITQAIWYLITAESLSAEQAKEWGLDLKAYRLVPGVKEALRRFYHIAICDCGSYVQFYWKKAKVDNLDVICDSEGNAP